MSAESDLCEKLDTSTWERLSDRLLASRRKRLDAAFKLAECVDALPWDDEHHYEHKLGRLRHCETVNEAGFKTAIEWKCYPQTVKDFMKRLDALS